jgi:hypothetical protein
MGVGRVRTELLRPEEPFFGLLPVTLLEKSHPEPKVKFVLLGVSLDEVLVVTQSLGPVLIDEV